MLLEMALAEFSYERDWTVTNGSSGSDEDSPVRERSLTRQSSGGSNRRFDERTSRQNVVRRSCSSSSRSRGDDVQEVDDDLEDGAPPGRTIANRSASSSDQFYGSEAAVPFEWEDSPGKPIKMVQETGQSSSRSRSSHPEPLSPLPLPPAIRPIPIGGGSGGRSVRNSPAAASSPIRSQECTGIGGKVRSSIISVGKDSRTALLLEKAAAAAAAPDFLGLRGRRDSSDYVNRDSVNSSDDGEGASASPVSTLDLPMSPLTCSPQQEPENSNVRRYQLGSKPGGQQASSRLTTTSHWTNTIMSEELPAVMEEDEEEDLESAHGYHTMEFQKMESQCCSSRAELGDWRLSGREVLHSKSFSAPNSRQNSSLRQTAANVRDRGRRRSDFDWPEDFDEGPEEVVKEVDESLWAFSPIASTFVFSGNNNNDTVTASDHRNNRSLPAGVATNGISTPPVGSSSPGLATVLEHISFRKNTLLRSASAKLNFKSGPHPDVDYPSQRSSSRLRHYSVNGDDEYASSRGGHSIKRSSSSCLPFFSLCSTQRPTAISFSQRLGPSLSDLHN